MRPDRWSSRSWTPEERRALAGLGPAWRLARKATGAIACPTCGAVVWTRCPDGLHPDRLFAYAAHLRASTIAPPEAASVASVAAIVDALGLKAGDMVHSGLTDEALNLAAHHGLLRLEVSRKALRPSPRWVLSNYGAACWGTTL